MSRASAAVPRQVFDAWRARARALMDRPLTEPRLALFGGFMLREILNTRGGPGFPAPSEDRQRFGLALAHFALAQDDAPDDGPERAERELALAEAEVERVRLVRHSAPKAERRAFAVAQQDAEQVVKAKRRRHAALQRERRIDEDMAARVAARERDRARIVGAGLAASLDERGGGRDGDGEAER